MTTKTLIIPDFSEWQGGVDWAKVVGGGYPAAIIRVFNGTRADKQYARNRSQAHAHHVKALGLYAFLNPGGTGHIEDQAADFVKLVGKLQPGEWPIVDHEAQGLTPNMAKTWISYVGRHLHGAEPWLYSSEYLFRTQHLDSLVPAKRTWLAAYGPHEPKEGHELWQYTDHRTIPGVAHPCDASTFHGDVTELLHAVALSAPATSGPTAHPSHPYPAGIKPGSSKPSARPLQRALKATGWLAKSVPESDHYGLQTERAVSGFNLKHGFNARGVSRDPAIGPHGWALLMTLAYGRD